MVKMDMLAEDNATNAGLESLTMSAEEQLIIYKADAERAKIEKSNPSATNYLLLSVFSTPASVLFAAHAGYDLAVQGAQNELFWTTAAIATGVSAAVGWYRLARDMYINAFAIERLDELKQSPLYTPAIEKHKRMKELAKRSQ